MDEDGESRTLEFNNGVASADEYVTNAVKTSKYTLATFVPMNLWEQLHKFGNVYFLCISIIMYIGEKTDLFVGTIKAFSTLGLLLMMMSITAAMSLLDDIKRKQADKQINKSRARVVSASGNVEDKAWEKIVVGDFVLVDKNAELPADVVPLFCSGEGGNCYVSTANLDGETNLKLKTAPSESQALLSQGAGRVEQLRALSGRIEAEAPNGNIHDFNGSMELYASAPCSCSLGAEQLLMRGTVLRNTDMCLGMVVYTGADTRMVRNSRPAPMKQSNLEKITNTAMFIILSAQSLFAFITAFLHCRFSEGLDGHWYLYREQIQLPELIGWWLTFFTLYSNLMPISLYPTVEFCNAFQCYFIKNDRHMYYKEKDFNSGIGFPANARTSNLCQELGQVSYMFSDKTGTLTQNDMELRRLSIAGKKFGTFDGVGGKPGFNGADELQVARSGPDRGNIDAFLEVLAVSHTVMASEGMDGKLEYEAESPDEDALVQAAADLGWVFKSRQGKDIVVELSTPGRPPSEVKYTLLATNVFNSHRKRMSVVIQKGNEYLLLIKGADNVMLERAAGSQKQLEEQLHEFSVQGLRTLVIGCRKLSKPEVTPWLSKFDEAQRATTDRNDKLEVVAEEIERSIEILGATAIEDKLQDGVPETIEKIRAAGIKLWVLTGDKLETAKNIGFSTKVLTPQMDIQIIDEELGTMDLEAIIGRWDDGEDVENKALMLTGKALQLLFADEDSKEKLLVVSTSCSVLIACRVSPAQKAELVQFIRDNIRPQPVTLSVGDGANDVPMIQTAQVGVGIAGKEGRQAVNNSDFAIAQFRYLERLLLVHGRWNYRRACKFTLFTFWRNMVQVMMIMWYTVISGFSGTCLYEDWIRLSFNALCSLPILAVGCLDEDVPQGVALRYPALYEVGRLGLDLNPRETLYTILVALLHACILIFITMPAFAGMASSGAGDYYTYGTICYTCLLFDVNYRVFFLTNTHNKYTIIAMVLSFVGYITWLVCYPQNPFVVDFLAPNMYMVPIHMVKNIYFWFCIVAIPLFAMAVDVSIHFTYHNFYPNLRDEYMNMLQPRSTNCTSSCSDESEKTDSDYQDNYLYDFFLDEDEASDEEPEYTDSDREIIDLSEFGQGRFKKFMMPWSPHLHVVVAGTIAGTVLLAIGVLCFFQSESYQQVRIKYAQSSSGASWVERMWNNDPIGTRDDEKYHATCNASVDGSQICTASIVLPRDLRKPLVCYNVGPYYQNYNSYMRSELVPELMGKSVTVKQRESNCVEPTLTDDATGKQFVPCGMKSASFFNDTIHIVGHKINYDNIAWQSDINRYNSPADYPERANTEWLYQRFPGVIPMDTDVKNPAFVAWMRPSAVPHVWNRYGHLERDLKKGETLAVVITSRYPIETIPGGIKSFVVTEHGAFGTRHSAFGIVLALLGIFCFLLAAAASLMGRFGLEARTESRGTILSSRGHSRD